MGRKIEGYWDCPCGSKANRGRFRNCPNCGRPRGASTKFYMIEKDNYVPESAVPKGPDWFCECCDSYNTYSAQFCTSCGAPKGASKDYFDIRTDLKRPDSSSYGSNSKPDANVSSNVRSTQSKKSTTASESKNGNSSSFEEDSYHTEEPKSDKSYSSESSVSKKSYSTPVPTSSSPIIEHNNNKSKVQFINTHSSDFFDIVPKVLIVLAVIAAIAALVYIFIPKEVDLTVDNLTWNREIRIAEYKTVRENDWYIPSGGRLVYTQQEIKDYKPIYERQAVRKSRTVITGYETRTNYTDLGNGYFDEETYDEPIYGTEYYTDYEDVLVGHEPIYATKYYYDIERWVYSRTVTSQGEKKSNSIEMPATGEVDSSIPYWPNTNLKSNERESGKYENFYVFAHKTNDKKQEIKKYSISRDLWDSITVNSNIKAVVQLGNVKEIKK